MKQNRLTPSILLGLNYFKKIETKEAHHTNQDTTLSTVEAGSRFKGDRDSSNPFWFYIGWYCQETEVSYVQTSPNWYPMKFNIIYPRSGWLMPMKYSLLVYPIVAVYMPIYLMKSP